MKLGTNSQEQPSGKVPFPHEQIQATIYLSYFADTEMPSRWEKLMINDDMPPTGMQTPDPLDLKDEGTDFYLPHPRMSMS